MRWTYPEEEQIEAVVTSVMSYCNARAISFMCPRLIIEIRVDGRMYQPHNLPAYFAGFSAIYCHQNESAFEGMAGSCPDRLIVPRRDVWDRTDFVRIWSWKRRAWRVT